MSVPEGVSEVEQFLRSVGEASDRADIDAWPVIYEELRRLARSAGRSGPRQGRPQTTTLVHEAFLRLHRAVPGINSEKHFYVVAARAMRQVLIDHLRARGTLKRRASGRRVALDEIVEDMRRRDVDLLALDEALTRLTAIDERKARVVELRFFAGLTVERVAELLDVGTATVERDWRLARAWLRRELGEDAGGNDTESPQGHGS